MRQAIFLAFGIAVANWTYAEESSTPNAAPVQQPPQRIATLPNAAHPVIPYIPIPATQSDTKAQHLRMAAAELRQAGLNDDAARYQKMADTIDPAGKAKNRTTVLIHVTFMEVALDKLRKSGVASKLPQEPSSADIMSLLGLTDNNPTALPSKKSSERSHILAGQIEPNFSNNATSNTPCFSVSGNCALKPDDPFFVLLKNLSRDGYIKVLAEPKLVTLSGKAANFHSGGELSVPIPQADGNEVQKVFKYGTQIEFLPVVLDQDTININIHAEIGQLDHKHSVNIAGKSIPGIFRRELSTTFTSKSGQIVVLSGLKTKGPLEFSPSAVQEKKSATQDADEEMMLLVLIKPEIVAVGE
jgi:Flp pilus assembly secretin CpaC